MFRFSGYGKKNLFKQLRGLLKKMRQMLKCSGIVSLFVTWYDRIGGTVKKRLSSKLTKVY